MIEKDRILAIESHHLLHSLRASDFDIPSAIGELVDNSIQAGAKKIHLNIEPTFRTIFSYIIFFVLFSHQFQHFNGFLIQI